MMIFSKYRPGPGGGGGGQQPSQAQLLDQLMNFFEKNKDNLAAASGPGSGGPGK